MTQLAADDLAKEPIAQFERWFEDALAADLIEPTAMVLATVGADGVPAARVVLLKDVRPEGFVFFTNYRSSKGRELAVDPRAALNFWWDRLGRQVRVEGSVERLPGEESDAYFGSRDRESQIGAHASAQSSVLSSRSELVAAVERVTARFADSEVPRPEHWGGFLLRPHVVEFWQNGDHRLHDRFRYSAEAEGAWRIERLAP